MFDKLVLIGLGFMFGFILAETSIGMATGVKPAASDVSALVASGLLLIGMLVVHWWEHRE